MKTIPLTQGYETRVDDEDAARLEGLRLCVHRTGPDPTRPTWTSRPYATVYVRGCGIGRGGSRGGVRGRRILLHRWLLDAPPELEVDHINGDTLDNRRQNLRLVTRSENAHNRRSLRGVGKHKGVRPTRSGKRWIAYFKGAVGKYRHLGVFDSEAEAARAYNVAAQAEYGDHARLNHVD